MEYREAQFSAVRAAVLAVCSVVLVLQGQITQGAAQCIEVQDREEKIIAVESAVQRSAAQCKSSNMRRVCVPRVS